MFTDTHCHLYDEVFETRKDHIQALALDKWGEQNSAPQY